MRRPLVRRWKPFAVGGRSCGRARWRRGGQASAWRAAGTSSSRRTVRGKARSTNSFGEKSLRSRRAQRLFAERTPVALPPPLFRTQLPAFAAASRRAIAHLPDAHRQVHLLHLKCSTRSACRVHRRRSIQISSRLERATATSTAARSPLARAQRTLLARHAVRSHAKVIFEHAVVARFSSGSRRLRYSATHGAVPCCWLRARRSTLGAREPSARRPESRAAARGRRSQEDRRASLAPELTS